jgi:hypothetical protein
VTSSASGSPIAVDFAAIERRIRDAVARVAATEPDPLDPFRGLYISDDAALRAAGDAGVEGASEGLAFVAERLALGPLDAAVLAFCAAPDLDARYARLLAYLHDDVTRRLPTPRLAARLLAGEGMSPRAVLRRFGIAAPLRRTGAVRLLDDDATLPLADRPVKLDERLAARLVGADLAPPTACRERSVAVPAQDPGREETVAGLRRVLGVEPDLPIVVCGADAPELMAWALGRAVLVLDARDAADGALLASARVRAALDDAELVLEIADAAAPEDQARVRTALDSVGGRNLACAPRRHDAGALDGRPAMVVEAPPPSLAERRVLWAAHDRGDPGAVDEVASKFHLSMRQIDHAAQVAGLSARARGDEDPSAQDLERGAREASRTRIGELAALLRDRRDWCDLVLPESQREQLRSISAYLRHRDRVLSEWGYESAVPSQGLKVLFAGESGTGKTMAAQVIATDLGLDVFRVDLATVVSKYIGETERNLDRIFAAAEGSNAILFFDEADALFGKRSEVKDAHDRYANIEVAYLLQRMETYPGAVVLATNYRRNIDEAFLRRLDFTIDFPFPDAADRMRIWRRLLPDSAPVGPDVDVEQLAARFELAGGSIRNSSVAAAFMAADDGGTIEMRHLVHAVAAEYRKMGRLTMDADFAPADAT